MKQMAGFLTFLSVVMRRVPGLCKDWSDLARWGRAATGCSTCPTPQQMLPAQVEFSWDVHLCDSGSTWFVQGPMRPDPGIEWESELRERTMVCPTCRPIMLQLEMACSQDLGSCDKHPVDMGTAGMKSKGLVPLRKISAGLCTETQKGCIEPCRGTKCALMQSLELMVFICA